MNKRSVNLEEVHRANLADLPEGWDPGDTGYDLEPAPGTAEIGLSGGVKSAANIAVAENVAMGPSTPVRPEPGTPEWLEARRSEREDDLSHHVHPSYIAPKRRHFQSRRRS